MVVCNNFNLFNVLKKLKKIIFKIIFKNFEFKLKDSIDFILGC